jgi:hypothetical protein
VRVHAWEHHRSSPTATGSIAWAGAGKEKIVEAAGEICGVTSRHSTIDRSLSRCASAYHVSGFAKLEKAKAEELSQQFQWQRTSLDRKPALTVTNLNLNSAEWSRSDAFAKDNKPQQILGELFFELQMGIIYFDLEIE